MSPLNYHQTSERGIAVISTPVRIAYYGITKEFGYMQTVDPVKHLGEENAQWDDLANNLPKYLMGSGFRERVKAMPPFAVQALSSSGEVRRAMLALSYIGQAYQWCDTAAADTLPGVLAKPWYAVGQLVVRPPILSYSSYSIDNWRRLDPKGPIECGNIALLQCFLGGQDEEWFILIHIDIEKRAGSALQAIEDAQHAVVANDADKLDTALCDLRDGIQAMYDVLARMPEKCDPYVYFHRVRPYILGGRTILHSPTAWFTKASANSVARACRIAARLVHKAPSCLRLTVRSALNTSATNFASTSWKCAPTCHLIMFGSSKRWRLVRVFVLSSSRLGDQAPPSCSTNLSTSLPIFVLCTCSTPAHIYFLRHKTPLVTRRRWARAAHHSSHISASTAMKRAAKPSPSFAI